MASPDLRGRIAAARSTITALAPRLADAAAAYEEARGHLRAAMPSAPTPEEHAEAWSGFMAASGAGDLAAALMEVAWLIPVEVILSACESAPADLPG